MLKSFVYMKNYRRIMIIFSVLLLYISMYLIHNAYGTLCIIKTGEDNKSNEGDIEASRLYKVNNSNLFAVSNAHFLSFFLFTLRYFFFICVQHFFICRCYTFFPTLCHDFLYDYCFCCCCCCSAIAWTKLEKSCFLWHDFFFSYWILWNIYYMWINLEIGISKVSQFLHREEMKWNEIIISLLVAIFQFQDQILLIHDLLGLILHTYIYQE